MSFEQSIKNWVTTDNKIRSLNDQIRALREERNTANDTNKLANATVKISDGKLRFTSTRQTAPLTLKYIEGCLMKCIQGEEQVGLIMKYIKESRNVKHTPDIKRYYENK